MKQWRSLFTIILACGALSLTGCSAMHTAVSKRNLDVQTKMSETVFLDPVSADKRVVFLQIRNTSDKQNLQIEPSIKQAITSRGYRLTDNPDEAHYMVQANVLKVGKSDLRESQGLLASGYGAGALGAAIGASTMGSGSGKVGTGILAGAVAIAGNALVKDNLFTMVTDLQISERAEEGVVVTEENQARLKQGTSGFKKSSSSKQTSWHRYQTRIVSTANKVNLEFAEALPELQKGLTQSISGLL